MNKGAMTITYITMQWPCASETFCARDVLALRALGHQVSVMALRPKTKEADYISKSQLTGNVPSNSLTIRKYIEGMISAVSHPFICGKFLTWIFKNEIKLKHLKAFVFLIPALFYVVDQIVKNKPDIVHLFWGHYPSGVAEILRLRLKDKCPPITMFLGAYDLSMGLKISEKAAKLSKIVFTHSSANIDSLQKMEIPASKIKVIHRGIDIGSMENLALENSLSTRDPMRITFVGRLVKAKNVESLLYAIKNVISIYPDIHLDIIGEGPEKEHLQYILHELNLKTHVTLHGYLPPNEVYSHLYQSSYFIFPSISDSERLPNAVKEAMYAGVIPIVSNTLGIKELVVHGESGFIFDSASIESIAKAILEGLQLQNLQKISQNAHNTIVKNFDVRVSMSQYADVWKSL